MKKRFICTLYIAVSAFAADPVRAADMVMGTDDWPPFRMSGDAGFEGLDLDFIAEVGRRLDANVVAQRYPWGRSLKSMESGAIDIMTGLAYRDERAGYIHYTDTPYYTCSTVFYTPAGMGKQLRSYEDLKTLEIGYVLHSAYFEPFDSDSSLNKVGVAEEGLLIQMLANQRIQAIVGTDCQADYYIAEQQLGDRIDKAAFAPGNDVKLYLGIAKKSPWAGRLDDINAAVKAIVEEGFVDEAAKTYYGPDS